MTSIDTNKKPYCKIVKNLYNDLKKKKNSNRKTIFKWK